MNQQTSGQKDLAKQRMEHVQNVLDEYEKSLALPEQTNPLNEEEFNGYFSMDRAALEKLSAEDCAQISYRLSQYSFFLLRSYNREKSRVAWCNNQLNKHISPQLSNYDRYMKHETKEQLIAKEDKYVSMLLDIVNYAKLRVARLENLSYEINNLKMAIINVQKTKTN